MALTMEDLAKMITDTRTYIGDKVDTSLAKILQELSDTKAFSESRISNLESKIAELEKENLLVKERKCKMAINPGVEESLPFINNDHALMNTVVLDNIIRYLPYADMRNMRHVCRRWKEVSEPVFWKISKIAISNDNQPYLHDSKFLGVDAEAAAESIKMLMQTLKNVFPFGMPSNEILFSGQINSDLLDYVWKESESLTFTSIYFRYCNEPFNRCIDLNYYLSPHLKTLNIKGSLSNFKISLENLTNIQNLRLEGCEIFPNAKIAPRELRLGSGCSISYEGKVFLFGLYFDTTEKILINQFVDFSKIRKLSLRGKHFKLDVGVGVINLEEFKKKDVELIGLANSEWTTNRLDFNGDTCIGDKMEFRSLFSVENTNIVDIQTLPVSIESLYIAFNLRNIRQLIIPHTFPYPNLKSLRLILEAGAKFPILFDFTNTSLVDFHLGVKDDIYEMDFDQIKLPNCIKRVKLCNVNVTTDVSWQLDTLILDEYPLAFAKSVLRHFNAIKLVLNFDTALKKEEDKMSVLNLWINGNYKQLAIGEIRWESILLPLNSNFFKSVDTLGSHFLFTKEMNGKGKAIAMDAFFRLRQL